MLLLLLLGAYGIYGGIESRGRVYEIIYWTLAVLLLIMLAFSVGSVDTDKWMPFLYDSGMDFLGSTYLVFGIFSWIIFLLFLRPHCAEPEKLGNTAARAVLVTGGLLFFHLSASDGDFWNKGTGGNAVLSCGTYEHGRIAGWIFRAVRRIDGGDMVLCAVCFDGSYDLSQCEYFYAYIFFKK